MKATSIFAYGVWAIAVMEGGRRITNEEAAIIIKNLKPYLKNAEKLADKKLHEDVYVALDMAIEALKGKERIDGN